MNTRNRGLILASLIAAAPACAATSEEIENVDEQVESLKVSAVYTSSQEFDVETYDFDNATNTAYKKVTRVKVRITIARAGRKGRDYRYDGSGAMAHELKIEMVDRGGRAINWDGETYYAKAAGKTGEFRLYNCASTNNCHDDSRSDKSIVQVSRDEKSMTISGLRAKANGPRESGSNGIFLADGIGPSLVLTRK